MQRSNVFALKGNHEQMMIDAAKDKRMNQGWFYNGGLSTLNSFGVKDVKEIPGQKHLSAAFLAALYIL